MWTIQRNTASDGKQDSISQIEKNFRSAGIGKSGHFCMYLYPFRWNLVNQVEDSVRC